VGIAETGRVLLRRGEGKGNDRQTKLGTKDLRRASESEEEILERKTGTGRQEYLTFLYY
jgi:hypothetical protein